LFSVLDASGKLPEGLMMGNLILVGSYSSCLDVNVLPHMHNQTLIEGFRYKP
jgi:hypothetical protein